LSPYPTTLGTDVVPPSAQSTAYPGDLDMRGAYTLSAEMKPWRELYTYFIVLDGGERVFPAKAQLSPTGDQLDLLSQSSCSEATAARTTHTVQARATLAFAPTVESPIVTIDFTCKVGPATVTVGQYPGGSDSGATESSRSNANSNGCSVGRGSSSTLAFFGLGLGLVALVSRSRRRTHR
jgi:hypothetical protein